PTADVSAWLSLNDALPIYREAQRRVMQQERQHGVPEKQRQVEPQGAIAPTGTRRDRATVQRPHEAGLPERLDQGGNVNGDRGTADRKSTRLNSSHQIISYA